MQVHSWRSQLQVSAVVQASDRKQPDLGTQAPIGNLIIGVLSQGCSLCLSIQMAVEASDNCASAG